MQPNQSCGKCIFWERHEPPQSPVPNGVDPNQTIVIGKCRRYPPQIVVLTEMGVESGVDPSTGLYTSSRPVITNNVRGQFPTMGEDSIGCGEFQELTERQPGL